MMECSTSMSPSSCHTVSEGDHLFIFINSKQTFPLKVTSGQTFQTKFGPINHRDLIGVHYGTKVNLAKGWVYLLPFTPEMWTLNLPHRTQILYATDIAMITSCLTLKPGSVVVESGTGSGSLTHSIIRTIAPNGYLYTFDFHEARAEEARKELDDHGLGKYVKVEHRDVCQMGFGLKGVADAVFLDLPRPWDAIPFAHEAMKPAGARICCFSPCIEQVQKTHRVLHEHCFIDIETIELILRPYEVKTVKLDKYNFESKEEETPKESSSSSSSSSDLKVVPTIQIAGHTGFLTFATKI